MPTTTAAAVRSIGRKRTAPASTTASSSAIPWRSFSSMKSTRMIELRTMIPAPAMKPIIDVAVKNAPKAQWPGRIPISDNGIGKRIASGTVKDWNQPITRIAISTSTTAKAMPRSRNTS